MNNNLYKHKNIEYNKEVMPMAKGVVEILESLRDDQIALKSLLLIGKHGRRQVSDIEDDLGVGHDDAKHATDTLLDLGVIRHNPHPDAPSPKFRLTEKGFLFLTQFKAVNKQARDYLGDKAQFIITP